VLAGVKAVLIYRKKQVRQGQRRVGVQDKQSYLHPGPHDRNTREHPDSGVRMKRLRRHVKVWEIKKDLRQKERSTCRGPWDVQVLFLLGAG